MKPGKPWVKDCACSGLLNELPLMDTQTGLGCEKEARVPEPLHFPGEVATSGKGHKMGRTLRDSGPQCLAGKLRKEGT